MKVTWSTVQTALSKCRKVALRALYRGDRFSFTLALGAPPAG
ncbi:hypothetical protein [Kitasatospora sp. NPDC094011]